MRYVKSLFTNTQKQWKMLKISLLFKKFTNLTREFLGLRNFQGNVFISTQTYREIFKPALVYL